MKIHVYRRNLTSGAVSPHILAVIEGFRAHGLNPLIKMPGAPEPCDLAVTWAYKSPAESASGRRALIVERGYVGNRFTWTSLGYDGLNGRADFCNANSPGDRWRKLCEAEGENYVGGRLMQPWRDTRHDGDYVLIMGQVVGDASLRQVRIEDWYRTQFLRLRNRGIRTYFRNHPLNTIIPQIDGLSMLPDTVRLDEALLGAKWVVTYNSNSGVDAVLSGVPVVAMDKGSMVYDIAGRNPDIPPPMLDRTQWSRNIAYCQWTLKEIASGAAWEHLKKGMNDANL